MVRYTAFLLLLAAGCGSAATGTVDLAWRGPTAFENGDPIQRPVTITIHRMGAEPFTLEGTFDPGARGTHRLEAVPCGTHEYFLTATVDGEVSGPSNRVIKDTVCQP